MLLLLLAGEEEYPDVENEDPAADISIDISHNASTFEDLLTSSDDELF